MRLGSSSVRMFRLRPTQLWRVLVYERDRPLANTLSGFNHADGVES